MHSTLKVSVFSCPPPKAKWKPVPPSQIDSGILNKNLFKL